MTMPASHVSLLLLLIGISVTSISANHFRGGTLSWKPTGIENQVQVTYRIQFNGFRNPYEEPTSDHDVCTKEAKETGELLGTPGFLECYGCTDLLWRDMQWRCYDFDIEGGWDVGGDSFTVNVDETTKKAVIFFNQCCWLAPLKNAPEWHIHQGYKMMTEVYLRPRLDTGEINASPETSPIPVQLFHSGCKYWLEIPVTDPDHDAYRCRYTNADYDECYDRPGQSGDKHADICGKLPYVTIHPNCTLEFDTSGGARHYAVRLMIEDLDLFGNPMSKISLSFLLEVSKDDSTCDGPRIILPPPGDCQTIAVGDTYTETIIAEAATNDLFIQRIETSKPSSNMKVSTLYDVKGQSGWRAVDISWSPSAVDVGKHNVGFNAVDKQGFSSGWSFMTVNVVEAGTFLRPKALKSNPSEGQKISSTNGWRIRFNNEIIRPSQPAYITLLDRNGNIVDRLDASKEEQVSFSGQDIYFSVLLGIDLWGVQVYTLRLDEGVAIDAEHPNCPIYSRPDKWDVIVVGGEKPATRRPTTMKQVTTRAPTTTPQAPTTTTSPEPPIYKCTDGNVDIDLPPDVDEGQECFIYLQDSAITVPPGNDINVAYKICCETSCKDLSTGPAGPPGTK